MEFAIILLLVGFITTAIGGLKSLSKRDIRITDLEKIINEKESKHNDEIFLLKASLKEKEDELERVKNNLNAWEADRWIAISTLMNRITGLNNKELSNYVKDIYSFVAKKIVANTRETKKGGAWLSRRLYSQIKRYAKDGPEREGLHILLNDIEHILTGEQNDKTKESGHKIEILSGNSKSKAVPQGNGLLHTES